MSDLPLSGKKKKTVKKPAISPEELQVQQRRAEAAELRLLELEEAPTLLVRLTSEESESMRRQNTVQERMTAEYNKLAHEASTAKTIAIMISSSYNQSWMTLRTKYGFPEDVDVDWETGEVFRRKVPTKVDTLKED